MGRGTGLKELYTERERALQNALPRELLEKRECRVLGTREGLFRRIDTFPLHLGQYLLLIPSRPEEDHLIATSLLDSPRPMLAVIRAADGSFAVRYRRKLEACAADNFTHCQQLEPGTRICFGTDDECEVQVETDTPPFQVIISLTDSGSLKVAALPIHDNQVIQAYLSPPIMERFY